MASAAGSCGASAGRWDIRSMGKGACSCRRLFGTPGVPRAWIVNSPQINTCMRQVFQSSLLKNQYSRIRAVTRPRMVTDSV